MDDDDNNGIFVAKNHDHLVNEHHTMSSDVGSGCINLENLKEQSESEQSEYDLAFQLFEGEEMNANMANFIGIHRMSILNSPGKDDNGDLIDQERQSPKNDSQRIEMPFSVNSDELHQIFCSGDEDGDGGGLQY